MTNKNLITNTTEIFKSFYRSSRGSLLITIFKDVETGAERLVHVSAWGSSGLPAPPSLSHPTYPDIPTAYVAFDEYPEFKELISAAGEDAGLYVLDMDGHMYPTAD